VGDDTTNTNAATAVFDEFMDIPTESPLQHPSQHPQQYIIIINIVPWHIEIYSH
jgi:hypothetical protein